MAGSGLLLDFRKAIRSCIPLPSTTVRPSSDRAGGPNLEIRTMANGTVKWFNAQKGYGFIQPESGGKDVFVHISALERAGIGNLNEGQKVSFDLEQDQRGKTSAGNLRLV